MQMPRTVLTADPGHARAPPCTPPPSLPRCTHLLLGQERRHHPARLLLEAAHGREAVKARDDGVGHVPRLCCCGVVRGAAHAAAARCAGQPGVHEQLPYRGALPWVLVQHSGGRAGWGGRERGWAGRVGRIGRVGKQGRVVGQGAGVGRQGNAGVVGQQGRVSGQRARMGQHGAGVAGRAGGRSWLEGKGGRAGQCRCLL